MTEQELFKVTFSRLHAAENTISEVHKKAQTVRRPVSAVRRTVTIAVAAVLALALSAMAYGVGTYLLNSPEQAKKAAERELAEWKELGIISADITLNADNTKIIQQDNEIQKDRYFFNRILKPNYYINSYGDKYSFHGSIDMQTGKLTDVSIDFEADESDVPQADREVDVNGKTYYFYSNTDDIIADDLTLDERCSRLAAYWGFDGYTFAETKDYFYRYSTDIPDGDALVKDLLDKPYVSVHFDGDQEGVPMYIQLQSFPGLCTLTIGTLHSVG